MLVREEPSVYVFTSQTQAGVLTERKAKSNKKRQKHPQRQLNDYRERQNNLREQETTTKTKKIHKRINKSEKRCKDISARPKIGSTMSTGTQSGIYNN